MLIGGVVGLGYFVAFDSVNWDFLPEGVFGALLVSLMYLIGFIGLIYAMTASLRTGLPQLRLTQTGEKTPREVWRPRLVKGAGALALALLPFVLEQLFSKQS